MVPYALITVKALFVGVIGWISFAHAVPVMNEVEVSFQVTTISVTEDVYQVNFTLDITGQVDPSSSTTVSLIVMDDTAVADYDYLQPSSPITSSVGDTTVSGSVRIIDDDENEDPEMFTVQIVSCTNTASSCTPAMMNATVMITINDEANDVITVSPTLTAVTVREPDLMAMIELNSNLDFEGDDVPITITYVTTDGTATAGTGDYTSVMNGNITSQYLATTVEITVNIINDFNFENDETFFVNLTGCSPGCVISPDSNAVTVTIQSDEMITVTPAMTAVTVQESDQMVEIQINATASFMGTTVPFTLTYTTTDITARGGDDFAPVSGSITADPYQTSPPPSIIFNITDDTLFENNETFIINFTSCSPALGCVIPSDSNTVTVTIQSDNVGVGFQANSTTISVSEDDGLVTFTLEISGPVDPASVTTVYLTVSNDTADMNDYENFTSQISSLPGGITVSGSVVIIDDNVDEDTESFSLHIHNCTNTVGGCSVVTAQYSTITINDNDITPNINPELMDQTQDEGDTASFTCQAIGEPIPTITWYFNGALVDESNMMKYTISMMSFNTTTISSTLMILNVESSDVGAYTCNATNTVSSDTSSAVLTVNVAPIIIMPVEGLEFIITEGSNGSITCTATGHPAPMVVWQNSDGSSLSNNRLVSGSPVMSSTGVGNVSNVSVELMVIGAMRVDSGMYRCTASNSVNSATTNITITVQFAPTIITGLQTQNVTAGEQFMLTCNATGYPVPSIEWMLNGTSYIIRDPSVTTITLTEELQFNTSVITVTNAMTDDTGMYECVAINVVDTDMQNATVIVQNCPDEPIDVQIFNVSSRSLTINWTRPHDNNDPITGYNISYQNPDHVVMANGVEQNVTVFSADEQITITDLIPGENYTFTVISINNICPSLPSVPATVRTMEEAPSVAVQNVMISNITDGGTGSDIAIVIEWNPPAYPNGIIHYYRIEFGQISDPLDVGNDGTRKRNILLDETVMNVFANITEDSDGAPTNVTIGGLVAFRVYNYSIFAATSVGEGPSADGNFVTREDTPLAPTNLTVDIPGEPRNSTTLLVSWERPTCDRGVLSGYELCYMIVNASFGDCDNDGEKVNITGPDQLSCTINGLSINTNYTVELRGRTGTGLGDAANATGSTDEDAPDPVMGLSVEFLVQNATSGIYIVTWMPPSPYYGSFYQQLEYSFSSTYTIGPRYYETVNLALDKTVNKYNISNALYFTNYTFTITTINIKYNIDNGPVEIYDQSLSAAPTPVHELFATPSSPESIFITWDHPEYPNSQLLECIIFYRMNPSVVQQPPNISSDGFLSVTLPADTTYFNLSGLTAFTNYTIHITVSADGVDNAPIEDEVLSRTNTTVPLTLPTQPSTVTPPPTPSTTTITVVLPSTDEIDTGELYLYGVVVVTGMELRNSPVDIISANNGRLPPPYPGEGGVYTAAVYTRAEDIPDVFVVGDSTTTVAPDGTEHVNRRLSEDTMYGAFYYIRLQSDNGIADEGPLLVDSEYISIQSTTSEEDDDDDPVVGVAVGVSMAILMVLILLAATIVACYYRNRHQKKVYLDKVGCNTGSENGTKAHPTVKQYHIEFNPAATGQVNDANTFELQVKVNDDNLDGNNSKGN